MEGEWAFAGAGEKLVGKWFAVPAGEFTMSEDAKSYVSMLGYMCMSRELMRYMEVVAG